MKKNKNAEMLANLTFNLLARCQEKESRLAKQHNLLEAEFKCLRLMSSEENPNNKEIAEKMNLSPSRITRIMDGLIKKGYMFREINNADRRNMVLSLSKRGKNLTTRLNNAFIEIHQDILNEIDEKQHAPLIIAVENLHLAIDRWLQRPK